MTAKRDSLPDPLTAQHICEVCEQPIPDGESIIDTDEGTAFCAPCAASLLGAERVLLRAALEKLADPEIAKWMAQPSYGAWVRRTAREALNGGTDG